MGLGSRILRNATYLALGDKVGYLIQFVFFLYFARSFGVVPVGEYSFGFSFTFAFAVLADWGISLYLVREVARNRSSDRSLVFDSLVLRCFLIIVVFSVASAILLFLFGGISAQKLRVIACWGGYWVFFSVADVFLAEMNGHEKMGQVALLGISLKLASTAAGILLIRLGFRYDVVLVVLPISSLVYLCACVLVSTHYFGFIHGRIHGIAHYRGLVRELLPFLFAVILVELLWCQDVLILGILRDDEAVGIYSSGLRIAGFILGVSPFFHTATLPVLSRLFVESKEKLVELSGRILRYLVLGSLPLSLGLALTADKVISLLYPESFQQAGIVLTISSWIIAVGLTQAIFSVLLTAINRQKEKVVLIAVNFALSTLLNLALVYRFSYVGASVVKLISALLGLVFYAWLVAKYLQPLSILRPTWRPAIACLVMGVFLLHFRHWGLIGLAAACGIVYLVVLLALGAFTQAEIRFVKGLIPRRLHSW